VRPFGFGDRTFDNHMIDLSVIVSLLPLVSEIDIGASGDSEDCTMGGEVVALLWRLGSSLFWCVVFFGVG
jgi:hypothetical protein